MNNYNNTFGKPTSFGEAAVRFNKRPRFGGNTNNNGSTRYPPHQKQTLYPQYSGSKHCSTETYQSSPNQYDSGPRNYFGQNLSKRPPPQHNPSIQINKPSTSLYNHNMGSPSSSFSPTMPNTLKPPPPIPSSLTQALPAARNTQNNQQQQPPQGAQNFMDSSNYYSYGYNNFYPTYGTEMIASTPTPSTYTIPDAMSPYMWQTITSTPPPKLPLQTQQQQLPPPPLPQQQPPALPPLPGANNTPAMQPPPPSQAFAEKDSTTKKAPKNKNKTNELKTVSKTIVKMRAKRKAMSVRYKLSKSWTEVDAAMALKAEEVNARKLQKDTILIIRFPDPEISREIVKHYSPDIESVHFQLNFAPRYCLVHLKPDADVTKTIENLSKIPFGTGFLSVEIKQLPHKTHSTKLNEIDPYTLYVGNLPTTIACKTLKDHFPGAARIDIGFAQRMKYTRYAFIRYQTVQQAIEAYKRMLDAEIGGRSLTIRFRRLTAASDGNRDGDVELIDEAQDEILIQSTVASDDNSTVLNPVTEPSETLDQKSSIDDLDKGNDNYTTNLSNEICPSSSDLNESNDNDETSVSQAVASEAIASNNRNRELVNIKPDPDVVDPADVVVRSNAIATRFDNFEENVKQEKELSTDFEFFAPASNVANRDKSAVSDTVSIHSVTDETDTMSTMSASSLGEFLQTCQRPQVVANDIDDIIGPPLKKKNRQSNNDLIKTEPPEPQQDNTQFLTNNTIKREVVESIENTSMNNIDNIDLNESTLQQNRNTNDVSHKKDKSLTRRKTKTSKNTDDLVPSNALFLREDNQNSVSYDYNAAEGVEFFETNTKINFQTKPQVIENIKTEPISKRISANQNKRITSCHQSGVINKIFSTSQIQAKNSLTRSNSTILSAEEDDIVPEENILSSRLTNQTVLMDVKQESETEDIFSAPFQTNLKNDATNSINEDSNLSDLWGTNLLKQNVSSDSTNKVQKTTEATRNCATKGSNEDNDIILVSDNIAQQQRNSNPKSSLIKKDLFSYNQSNLLTFIPKTSAAITNLESSKLLSHHHHHDNLDKLFAQLDADKSEITTPESSKLFSQHYHDNLDKLFAQLDSDSNSSL